MEKENRRSFLSKLLSGTLVAGGGVTIGSIFAYLLPPHRASSRLGPRQVKIGKVADIPIGTGKLALVDGEPVWVVHLARGFVGLSATCTHKGCIIEWKEKRKLFSCPCHNGLFDTHGNVIAGLPRWPLSHFQVGSIQGDLYVAPQRAMPQYGWGSPERERWEGLLR
jgi:cytochrome b6-f complex iron-sulfur subunit